jgi:hypothetical protein
MIQQALDHEDMNVIAVDWSNGTKYLFRRLWNIVNLH